MTTGLVLSGGGIRGVAHIGAIKALEEYGIYPTHIAGTSAGAIVGALYAAGCNWEEMLDFFKSTEIFSLTNYAMGKPGFLDTEKFHDQLKAYISHDTFESLGKQLYVLASAAVPGLFAPVEINKGYYVDGGTLNNFPVDLIKKYCDQIVGVYVNPFNHVSIKELNHVNKVLERAYHVMVANETTKKFKDCDILIRPANMDRFGMFTLKNLDIILDLGYNATMNALKNSDLASELLSAAELEAMNGFSMDTSIIGNPQD